MNKFNKNNKNEDDLNDEFKRKKEEIRRKKEKSEYEKAQRSIQRRKKIKAFFKKNFNRTKKYTIKIVDKCIDPNFILSLFTALYFYRQLHKMEDNLNSQQQQIAAIERNINSSSYSKNPSLKNFCKENLTPIILGASGVLIPVGKQIYRSWATNRKLVQAQDALVQTQGQLVQTQDQLEEANQRTIEVENKYKVKISRLYVTLKPFHSNRLHFDPLNGSFCNLFLLQKIKI